MEFKLYQLISQTQEMDAKKNPRKLFPSSSTHNMPQYESSGSSSRKKTTDEIQVNAQNMKKSLAQDNKRGRMFGDSSIKYLSEKEQSIIELRERLKNIHHFYRIRIEEERGKNMERNQIFIGIIQQLQISHNDRIMMMQNSLQEVNDQKKDINYVDQRMGSIKNTIEEILSQSKELKSMNEGLEKEIMQKQLLLKEKESQLINIKEELDQSRDKLEHFERLRLKQNKRNKQMIELIENTIQ